mmetsp:Transcript_17141/g.52711  ORF Transcript_17141/g.52711 Transcript_17141/m.52711 type:complete len:211 (-) Transcript_17141:42-674(-)
MLRLLLACLAASSATGGLVDLHDGNFEQETQCTTGATTGDWFVRIAPDKCEPEWVAKLNALDAALREHDSNWINVAVVELATNPELEKRFNTRTFTVGAGKNLLFVRGRMYDFTLNETNTTADFLRNFTRRPKNETIENGGRDVGLYIPRGETWYTPLTDKLDEFFEVVDYRMMSTGLTVLAVGLIVVGALVPQEHNIEAEKEEAAKKSD